MVQPERENAGMEASSFSNPCIICKYYCYVKDPATEKTFELKGEKSIQTYLFLNSRCKSGKEILFLLTNMDGRRRRMGPGLPNRAMAIYALRPLLQCLNVIARRLVKLWPVPARRVVLIALNAATAPRTARTNTPFKNSLMTAMI